MLFLYHFLTLHLWQNATVAVQLKITMQHNTKISAEVLSYKALSG